MTSSLQRQLSKLIGSHKSTHVIFSTRVNKYIRVKQCSDDAENKAETRVRSYPVPCKNHFFMTQLAADFAAKGLLNLMTSSPVATGLAH